MSGLTKGLRRAGLNLLLVLIASLLALGIGELMVRLILPQQLIVQRPDLFRPMDSLGYSFRPDVHLTVNTGDRTVVVNTDSGGFRVSATGRPKGRTRVLLLGDSFMAAMQVEYEQSLPGLIEQCFADRTGGSAAVWDTGVPGWDPPQYYVQARRLLEVESFDIVLVSVFLGNDIVARRQLYPPREADRPSQFRFPTRLSYREFVDALLAPVNDWLEARSHLFVFLKNRLEGLRISLGLSAVDVPFELRRREASSGRWGVTAEILADIDSLANAHGARSLFVLIPAVEQVDPQVLEMRTRAFGIDPDSLDVEQPDRMLGAELARRRLSVLSILPIFREAQGRGIRLYGQVDPHLSPDGHRVLWSALAPVLVGRLGLPDSGKAEDPRCKAP